jgi:DNA polymerase-3 subunit epsilon
VKHGALLDAQLLAQVYIELTGGRQIGLGLADQTVLEVAPIELVAAARQVRPARPHFAKDEELQHHRAFISRLVNPLWARFTEAS